MSCKFKVDIVPIVRIPNDERIQRLSAVFGEQFQRNPSFYVRVPGRVNIIGEHIDYCGYPVLPMALEQDIIIATGITDAAEINIRNVDSKYDEVNIEMYKINEIELEPDATGKPFWYNYVICGIKGALEYLKVSSNNILELNGLQMLVEGNIPPASGLSSSSALVSAACLSFLYAQNATLTKTEIASLCANCERYIGTQGGGMDQAIAFLAEKYSAQYITFNPLSASPVSLPEDASFVVAHSLAELNKAATNDFNRRVIECRLAAKIISVLESVSQDKKIITLSEVQNILGNSFDEMVSLVYKYLPKDLYTKEEVCSILNVTEPEMESSYLTPNTKHLTEFKLRQRALHVYEEAKRVEDFRNICKSGTMNGNGHTNGFNGSCQKNYDDTKETINILGQLMSDSHESLRKLYECSHSNLDRLVDLSKQMNIHSRLTGAGWGGCIVALCPKNETQKYIDYLIEHFYVNFCNIDKTKAKKYVFATTPNFGARILTDSNCTNNEEEV
ncbi:N-acetylgalactosamine kinase [Amyelois transitella]|uniref:N-acetylgalactosamine kinase n=1 Tax=Amyelois transitella TaxID=680683 RepID=UPI00067D650C|nr:N-acetylgalactosamine kinase [Amyelois transitella]